MTREFSYGSGQQPRYVKGQRVRHRTFGSGMIVEISGSGTDTIVTVDFKDEGQKRLMASVAPMKPSLNNSPPDEQVEQRIREVLDEAIAAVAEEEFVRLSAGRSCHYVRASVNRALVELKKLQGDDVPLYADHWVALFYLTWYQPRQINLAYSFLANHGPSGKPFLKGKRVVDLGCGALAMQFALGVFGATTDDEEAVRVCNVDRSGAMKRIGLLLWNKVCQLARKRDVGPLCRVVRALSYSMHVSIDECGAKHADWVTALHVYEKANPPKELVHAVRRFLPRMAVATAEQNKVHALDAVRLPSYARRECHEDLTRLTGCLTRTWHWRKNLPNLVPSLGDLQHGFLYSRVSWCGKNPVVRTWRATQ